MTILLRPEPLTRGAFARFGDVIETEGHAHVAINQGFAERFNDLARIDTTGEGGEMAVSLFLGEPQSPPISLKLVERHPLGSQLFFPLQGDDWIIVVAEAAEPTALRAFRASGRQGVNVARNVWHHPLLAPKPQSRFLIVDRKGPGVNLEEHWFTPGEAAVLQL